MAWQKTPSKIAVIGAGIAGASCARALAEAGNLVHVFDKSRGPGGRLATRRVEWIDRDGGNRTTHLDHGAVGFTARSPAFRSFVQNGIQAGRLAAWSPTLAADSAPLDDGPLHVPLPTMPALCRQLLDGSATSWSCAIDGLRKGPSGWQLEGAGEQHEVQFDAVVLALPPAQAATLLGPHRPDWARHASVSPMQPCWTLMGVAAASESTPRWDLSRPSSGPLAWVLRNDARPGRERVEGEAHWVAHARAGWSRRHLEQPAEWVQAQMQAALADVLGHAVAWQHSAVHRWRYAVPQMQGDTSAGQCWWDAGLGLGVCGDFLGGAGVEGAWLSARSLAAALLQTESNAAEAHAAPAARDPVQRLVA